MNASARDGRHGQARATGQFSSTSVGFVSTYPPTRCGIASFTASLRQAMHVPRCGVVALVDRPATGEYGAEVVAQFVRGSRSSLIIAANELNSFDVVVVQHEFGIYGGADGCEVVELVERLAVPAIVVLHTVLRSPSANQRLIIEELAAIAETVVVQTATAKERLLNNHDIPPDHVLVIPHGAPFNLFEQPVDRVGRRPVLLTWGLLGRGKGIEFAIEALADLRDLDPPPRYVVHGQTHPRVLEQEGEAYRESLQVLARALGVDDLVEFDDRYADKSSVLACVSEADVVILPYRSRDQVVSGVLVEAITSGKPVVATRFPHAVELLSSGSGILVPCDDASAIAAAVRALLTDPERAKAAAAVARQQARPHLWETVGQTYRELATSVARPPALALERGTPLPLLDASSPNHLSRRERTTARPTDPRNLTPAKRTIGVST